MISLIVKIRIKPEHRLRFLEAIEVDALGSEGDEPGCLCFNVLQDEADANVYYFYEVYKDEAAMEAHRAAPHYAVWREAAAIALDGAAEVSRAPFCRRSALTGASCKRLERSVVEAEPQPPQAIFDTIRADRSVAQQEAGLRRRVERTHRQLVHGHAGILCAIVMGQGVRLFEDLASTQVAAGTGPRHRCARRDTPQVSVIR
jgi:autoinducer 2-degrading protein